MNPFKDWKASDVEAYNEKVGRGRKKASDQNLIDSYTETKSVRKAGRVLGMCGQSVHERLVRLGVKFPRQPLSDDEKTAIEQLYRDGFVRGDGKLDALSKSIGRTKNFVARYAGSIGLTTMHRKMAAEASLKMRNDRKEQWNGRKHPRGFLGRKHSTAALAVMGAKSKAYFATLTDDQIAARTRKIQAATGPKNYSRGSWKSGWREIAGRRIFFRSQWEVNYAHYLETLKRGGYVSKWDFEPETFWFDGVRRGCVSYKPDFRVIFSDGRVEYHEVKGWMDAASKTKLRRMKKYHPDVTLVLRDAAWFKANRGMLKTLTAV